MMKPGQKIHEVFKREWGCEPEWRHLSARYKAAWAAVEAACVPAVPAGDDLIDRLTAAFLGHADHVDRNLFGRARDALKAQAAEIERLREERKNAQSTLSAWFDLSKKAEEAGASILAAALDTWLHRAAIGGMPSKHADIVRNVVGEAAHLYLWNALVPVLRTITDERAEAAEAKLREAVEWMRAINKRASPDPTRTFDDAIRDLEHVTTYARAFLATMEKTDG